MTSKGTGSTINESKYLFIYLLQLNVKKTKKHKKEETKKKCHKDGQEKSHRSHTRPTTMNLRKKKEKGIMYIKK